MRLTPATILAAALLLGQSTAFAADAPSPDDGAGAGVEVFKWTDSKGVVIYAREHPPGVRAEKIRIAPEKPGAFDAPTHFVPARAPAGAQPAAPGKASPADKTARVEPHCPPVIPKCRKKGETYVPAERFVRPSPEKDENGRVMH